MQLNWLYFCGIRQLIPLKLWPNTAQGCSHQSTCMPQSQPLCSAALVPMYYPEGMKARVSPVQWSKPYSILAPTQDSNPGDRIQNHKRWPLHYHCTLKDDLVMHSRCLKQQVKKILRLPWWFYVVEWHWQWQWRKRALPNPFLPKCCRFNGQLDFSWIAKKNSGNNQLNKTAAAEPLFKVWGSQSVQNFEYLWIYLLHVANFKTLARTSLWLFLRCTT